MGVDFDMTLVYDNYVCEQAIFKYMHSGENLKEDHIVFTIKKLISNFKRDFPLLFEDDYNQFGRPKEYFDDELLGLVVYGIFNSRKSCRKLSDWVNNNDESVNFIVNDKSPKKSIIHLFLQEKTLLINVFFHYTVMCGIKLGLIDGECVGVDGTILRANANNFRVIHVEEVEFLKDLILEYGENWCKNSTWYKLHQYYNEYKQKSSIIDLIGEIDDNLGHNALKLLKISLISVEKRDFVLDFLDVLMANYDGEHTISLSDPECRWMEDKKKNQTLSFNYQVAMDSKSGMAIDHYLTQSPTDHYELFEMLHRIKLSLGFNPSVVLADGVYMNDAANKYAKDENIRLLIPDGTDSRRRNGTNKDNPFDRIYFEYDWEWDVIICPIGEELHYKNDRKVNEVMKRVYSTKRCKTCMCKDKCTKSRVKEIFLPVDPLRWEIKADFLSPEGQEYYEKRANLNESIFGILRRIHNVGQLNRTGLENAQKELTLHLIAHNIQKIHNNLNATLI